MSDTPPTSGSDDFERAWYTALEGLGEKLPAADDFVKATDGPVAQKLTNGNVAVLLPLTPEGVKLMLEACAHVVDHDCEAGMLFARNMLETAVATVLSIE